MKLRPSWEYFSLPQLRLVTEIYLDQTGWNNVCNCSCHWLNLGKTLRTDSLIYVFILRGSSYGSTVCTCSWNHKHQSTQNWEHCEHTGLDLLCICSPALTCFPWTTKSTASDFLWYLCLHMPLFACCLTQVKHTSVSAVLVNLSPLPSNEPQRSLISMRPLLLCPNIYLLKFATSSKFMQVKGTRADNSMTTY